jgi:hypothetical protein
MALAYEILYLGPEDIGSYNCLINFSEMLELIFSVGVLYFKISPHL